VPSEERFPAVRRLLEQNGWSLVRISGSHHVFEKAGSDLMVIPVHRGKVKPAYVRKIQKIIQGD